VTNAITVTNQGTINASIATSGAITTNGVFLGPNGSLTNATYSTSGNVNTGVYFPSGNQVGLSANGVGYLFSSGSLTANGISLGTSGTPFGAIFSNAAVSAGSYLANSNGIETVQTTWGAVTSGAIVSAGATVTTGTVTNIVNLSSLPAGVYDISVTCDWNIFGATVTQQQCGLSYTAATFLTQAGGTSGGATVSNEPFRREWQTPAAGTTSDLSIQIAPVRVKLTSAATIYHTSALTFSVGTAKAFGSIRAVRVQ
jgi:hypothetical protein